MYMILKFKVTNSPKMLQKKFFVAQQSMNYADSSAHCKSLGGSLALPESAVETQQIIDELGKISELLFTVLFSDAFNQYNFRQGQQSRGSIFHRYTRSHKWRRVENDHIELQVRCPVLELVPQRAKRWCHRKLHGDTEVKEWEMEWRSLWWFIPVSVSTLGVEVSKRRLRYSYWQLLL